MGYQNKYYGRVLWGLDEEERINSWRGEPYITKDSEWEHVPSLVQRHSQSLAQGQPGPDPTDYDKHFDDLNSKISAHNAAWWAEHDAQIAKQSAVDAWRKGFTANTGPELPYSLWQRHH